VRPEEVSGASGGGERGGEEARAEKADAAARAQADHRLVRRHGCNRVPSGGDERVSGIEDFREAPLSIGEERRRKKAGARGKGFIAEALGLAVRHATDSEFAWILEGSLVFVLVRTGKPACRARCRASCGGTIGDPGPGMLVYGHTQGMGFSPAATLSLFCLPPWMKFACV
jgi:hypothetical protein